MQPFRAHTGLAFALDRASVDTDQIIPKQFLKRIERTGYGEFLFYDWRFSEPGKPNSFFILNEPRFAGASVLIAGGNFGCGSSREHAPWALLQYGFRAVIAPSFADIFQNNCLKNGLLPVVLPEDRVLQLMRLAEAAPCQVTVDLETQEVRTGENWRCPFSIDPFARHCLLEGLDEIGLTLQHQEQISAYERQRPGWLPQTR